MSQLYDIAAQKVRELVPVLTNYVQTQHPDMQPDEVANEVYEIGSDMIEQELMRRYCGLALRRHEEE